MSVDGRRKWKGKPGAQAAVFANRRRIDPVDKPREDVGHVLGPGFPAIMHLTIPFPLPIRATE